MKAALYGMILLLILGFMLSLYLLPSSEDYALMMLKGKKYSAAQSYYITKYAEGNRSADVTIPLETIDIAVGNNDRAIRLMEGYVVQHPSDVHARLLLGELYLDALRRKDYLRNLEEIKRLDPSYAVLDELHGWYEALGERDKDEQVLEEMIRKEGVRPDDYLDLARSLAAQQKMKQALTVMEQKNRRFPLSLDIDSVTFEMYLMNELEREQGNKHYDAEMIALGLAYIDRAKNDDKINDLVTFLHDMKRSNLVLPLIPAIERRGKISDALNQTIISLLWDMGEKERAFEKLMYLYRAQTLTPQLADLLANAALERGFVPLLKELMSRYNPALFSEGTLLWVASFSQDHHEPDLSLLLEKKLGEHYFKIHPAIHVALELAQNLPQAEKQLEELVRHKQYSSGQALVLMQMAFNAGYKKLSFNIAESLELDRMNAEELVSWALIYIDQDKENRALERLKQQLHGSAAAKGEYAEALLDTALGKADLVSQWFEKHEELTKDFLISLYFAAQTAKSFSFAVHIGERLERCFPGKESSSLYAQALVEAGYCEKALKMLRKLRTPQGFGQDNRNYLLALIACQEDHKKELKEYTGALLTRELSAAQARDIAYLLLEKVHDFDSAATLFWRLVHDSAAQIDDVEALLALTGPRPAEDILCTVRQLAKNSAEKDKLKWIKALQGVADYRAAYQIFLGMPTTAWGKSDFWLWIELLGQLKEKERLKCALSFSFLYLSEEEEFLKIFNKAVELELLGLQKEILHTLISKNPFKSLYWKKLALMEYALGNFTSALDCFNHYFACLDCDDDYVCFFDYGEILLARNDPCAAEEYYTIAMELIERLPLANSEARICLAAIYDRLKIRWASAAELAALYEKDLDPSVRAEWANELIAMGRLAQARHILYDFCETGFMTEQLLSIKWEKEVTAEFCISNQQIIISTSLPLSDSDFSKAIEKVPPGIKNIESALHTFLIQTENKADFFVSVEKDLNQNCTFLRVKMHMYPKPFEASLPIEIAKVNLALRDCDYSLAACLLEQLVIRHPENSEVLSLVSALEASCGKWQAGLNWLYRAHMQRPCGEGIWTAFRDLYFQGSPFISLRREAEITQNNSVNQYLELRSAWIMNRNPERFIYIEGSIERVESHMAVGAVVDENGLPIGFKGNRYRGFVRGRKLDVFGTESQYTVYMGEGVAGVGARWHSRFDQGNYFIYVDWNRPYWEINECLVHQGFISCGGTGAQYFYNARLDGALDVSLHQYGDNVARYATSTICVSGNTNWHLTLKEPFISLNYILDAEYVFAIEERVNPLGDLYQPVPLSSRENHTLRLEMHTTWRKWWTFGLFFGETFNRLGTHNPTAGISCHYFYPCGLEIDLSAERYPSTTVGGSQVNDLKGVVKWRF